MYTYIYVYGTRKRWLAFWGASISLSNKIATPLGPRQRNWDSMICPVLCTDSLIVSCQLCKKKIFILFYFKFMYLVCNRKKNIHIQVICRVVIYGPQGLSGSCFMWEWDDRHRPEGQLRSVNASLHAWTRFRFRSSGGGSDMYSPNPFDNELERWMKMDREVLLVKESDHYHHVGKRKEKREGKWTTTRQLHIWSWYVLSRKEIQFFPIIIDNNYNYSLPPHHVLLFFSLLLGWFPPSN